MPIPTSNSRRQNQDHTQTQVTEPPASGSAAAQPEDRAPVAAASATLSYTPGHWEIRHAVVGGDADVGITAPGCGGVIAECFEEFVAKGVRTPGAALANALLIAAAPRMFARIEALAKDGDAEAASIVEAVNGRS